MQEVALGIVVKEASVLLVEKKNPKGSSMWRFPGGKVETGESIESAVVREVEEETGIRCLPMAEIATRTWHSKDMKLRFFICEYISGTAKINEPEIFDNVRWVTPDLAEELIGKSAKIQIRNFLNWLVEGEKILKENGEAISLVFRYIKDFQHIDTLNPLPHAIHQLERDESGIDFYES